MIWVLVWAVLAIGATVVLGLLGLRLWRQAKALTRELGAASERLAEVSTQLAELAAAAEHAADHPRPAPPGGSFGRGRDRGVRSH